MTNEFRFVEGKMMVSWLWLIVILISSALSVPFFVAEAANNTIFSDSNFIVSKNSPYQSSLIGITGFSKLSVSVQYDAELLDNGDSFTYGWVDDDGEQILGTINGKNENNSPNSNTDEIGSNAKKLTVESDVNSGRLFIRVDSNGNAPADQVIVVTLNLEGDEIVPDPELNPNVSLCHATNGINPYQLITVDAKSIVNLPNGHDDHDDKGLDDMGDIIPPFDYNFGAGLMSYPGSENWDHVFSNGLTGEVIYNQGNCNGVPVNKSADVMIDKTVSTTTPLAGTSVTYTIKVTNNGPDEAKGLIVNEPLASGLSYQSASISPNTTSPLSWLVGSLASGASWSVEVVVMVSSSTAGNTVTNTASVSGSIFDPNTDNNVDSETIRPTTKTIDPIETCTIKVVSDEFNTVVEKANAYAKLVSIINPRWTAIVNAPAMWIWGDDPTGNPVTDNTYTFENKFGWSGPITNAKLTIAADNSYISKINNAMAGFDSTEFNYQAAGVDVYDVTSLIAQGNNIISVAVKNWAMVNGTAATNPGGLKYELVVTGTGKDCDIPYEEEPEEPEEPVATIIAHKIICTNESELPNWGLGGPNITASTASNWVNTHQSCSLANGWEFEWAPTGTSNPDNGLPINAFYGAAGGAWTKFGPTNASGTAKVYLDSSDLGSMSYVWLREVLKNEFIPFTYSPNNATNTNAVSAELYCHIDVENYDNYDRVDGIKVNNTYHCVAWNHAKEVEDPEDPEDPEEPVLTCTPETELITNGSFENEIVTDSNLWQRFASVLGWNIARVSNGASTTLELHRGWSGNLAAVGAQYAELDGDHSTLITQTIPTIPGKTYTLGWDFAPRQLVTSEQNQLAVLVNDSLVAQNGPMVGMGTLAVADWVPGSYSFVALSSSTKISFKNEGPSDSLGTFLDDVSLRCGASDDGDGDGDGDGGDGDGEGGSNGTTTPPVITPTENNGNGGGSSSGTRVGSRGRVAGSSTSNKTGEVTPLVKAGDNPQIVAVLGDQISAMPYGAPNAGHGGASNQTTPLFFMGKLLLAPIRTKFVK